MSLWVIKDGKLAMVNSGKIEELPDGIRAGYIRRTLEAAKRREWKTTGEGAKFTGTFAPDAAQMSSICANVSGIAEYGDAVYYAETIDSISGIYKKTSADEAEGIATSTNDFAFNGLDIFRHRAVTSFSSLGSHVAVADLPGFDFSEVTEGNTIESDPVWSRSEPDVIYFSSAGLPERNDAPSETILTPAAIMSAMTECPTASRGPASLCRLDLKSGEFETILEDDNFDFVKPYPAPDGSLYYIKRPYSQNTKKSGCLFDALMLPVRLLKALFGFLSFFSLKYSGTPLSQGNTKAKNQDAGKLFIEGNLIDAERELKANSGEKAPGIIPKSWELHKRLPDGSDSVLKRGVLCYAVCAEKLVFSNGRYLLTADDEIIAKGDGVTLIKEISD